MRNWVLNVFTGLVIFTVSCTRGPAYESCTRSANLDDQTAEACAIKYGDSPYLENYNPYYMDDWLFGGDKLPVKPEDPVQSEELQRNYTFPETEYE